LPLQIASNVLSVITGILLGRFLGPSGYGAYAFALGWVTVLCVPAVMGLDKVLVRMVPAYEVQGTLPLLRGMFRRTNQIVLALGILVGGTASVVGSAVLSSPFRTPFLVAMVLLPITALTLLRTGAMTALNRVVVGQSPEYVIQPVVVIVALVVVRLAIGRRLDATVATAVTVCAGALAFVVGRELLNRAMPRSVAESTPQYATREWLKLGLPMMLVAGISLLDASSSTIVVGAVGGAHTVGVFAVVARGAQTVALVLTALAIPLAPQIARLYAHGAQEEAQRLVAKTARVAFAGSLPIALGLIVFRHQCLAVFGRGFSTGGLALIIVVLGQLVNAASGPAAVVLSMTGNVNFAGLGIALGLVSNVGLCILLVPGSGVVGAAIAGASGMTVRNVMLAVIAQRRVGIQTSVLPASGRRSRGSAWTPVQSSGGGR